MARRPAASRKPAPAKRAPRKSARKSAGTKAQAATAARRWHLLALGIVLGAAALRLAINAAGPIPVHFDEAQYWYYGQELAFGHFSKPPLVGWLMRVSTALAGQDLAAMRFWSVASHAAIGWLLYLTGRRMFDADTGFWAAAIYTAAPGVTASGLIASTDSVMMAAWALALWAWLMAIEEGRARWWALMGVAIGLGFLAKYTVLAFAGGALGYALFSAQPGKDGRDWRGPALAAAVALAVAAPNLIWNALNGFATVAHVAEDAAGGSGVALRPGKFAEFAGSQLGVIGPVAFFAIAAAFWTSRDWRGDWRMRLLAWQTAPLLAAMLALALVTRAQPNWAAPAYVAGSLLAARWLVQRGWRRLLRLQLWIGAAAAALLWTLAALYADQARDLPRWLDPFKKMRLAEPVCGAALPAMAEEGADALLSADRRRLAECIFMGALGEGEFAVWNPGGGAENHFEMIASLGPGDSRRFLLVSPGEGAADPLLARFAAAEHVETLRFATHADQGFVFELWLVSGFEGYR